MLQRSFVHLDKDMFKHLFTSIIRPHLEYGAPIWNPNSQKLIVMIENVQRRASRQIPGLSHLTYQERLEAMKVLTLQYRRYRGGMIEMFKLSPDLYNKETISYFLDFRHRHTRKLNFGGHQFNLYKESCKKDAKRYSLKCRITNQWNNLPEAIAATPSLNTIKNRLDKLWECDGVMFDPDVDLYATTSSWLTRYVHVLFIRTQLIRTQGLATHKIENKLRTQRL